MTPSHRSEAGVSARHLFGTILVGFDGSDTGHDALALATGLAKASGARVVVGYIYDAALTNASMAAAAELLEHAEATLASARRQLSQGLRAEFEAVAASSPAVGLEELASRHHAGLIVLGSRGLGPVTRIALGSVSHRVVTDARSAVAVAPRGYRESGGYVPQAIGVGSGPGGQTAQAVALAEALASATAGTVTRVAPVRRERSEEAVFAEELSEELIGRSAGLDLLVVPSPSRVSGAPDGEPLALDVIERARCPVVIVPDASAGHGATPRAG
jgi:nucleotide-binding universal stress UspA family protein